MRKTFLLLRACFILPLLLLNMRISARVFFSLGYAMFRNRCAARRYQVFPRVLVIFLAH